ncbi:PAS domain S-box protein [Gigaspora margarita]|uniref:PAS domain S-box protein n=2 Tax=Gigaspora margarita TaxID=4874 RepID=A0A8H3X815_GIGMA|nr:PAS domain S-box protein [Gigaspora margarita]
MSLSITPDNDIKKESSTFINMVYDYDWSSTLLGPMDSWDPALKNAVNLCLSSKFPICLYMGSPHWTELYNEAWIPTLKTKHPFALGKQFKQVWPEAYDAFFPQLENVKNTGKGMFCEDQYFESQRDGYTEETYFNFTFSPVFKSDGTVCAIFNVLQETTQKVLNTRRVKVISEFSHRISEIKSLESACHIIMNVLSNSADIPYALIYFVDHKPNTARLIAKTFDKDNIPDYIPDSPEIIYLTEDINKSCNTYVEVKRKDVTFSLLKCDSWPIHLVIKEEEKHVKALLKDESQAVIESKKISICGRTLSAVLIYGINRFRSLDEQYMEFLKLVTEKVNIFLRNGIIIEEERKRSKLEADLNYQKAMFFQSISHELKSINL